MKERRRSPAAGWERVRHVSFLRPTRRVLEICHVCRCWRFFFALWQHASTELVRQSRHFSDISFHTDVMYLYRLVNCALIMSWSARKLHIILSDNYVLRVSRGINRVNLEFTAKLFNVSAQSAVSVAIWLLRFIPLSRRVGKPHKHTYISTTVLFLFDVFSQCNSFRVFYVTEKCSWVTIS